jgi:hypothetical protein
MRSFKLEIETNEFTLNLPLTETIGYAAGQVEAVRMCAVKQLIDVKKTPLGSGTASLEMNLPLQKAIYYLKTCVCTEPSVPVEFAVLQSRFRCAVRLGESEERLNERLLERDNFFEVPGE